MGGKGVLEFNPSSQTVSAYGNARLKLFKFGFTSTQVRLPSIASL